MIDSQLEVIGPQLAFVMVIEKKNEIKWDE